MSREQERSRLIQLIGEIRAYEHGGMATVTDEGIADHLLANGVIVPLVKAGDTLYAISKSRITVCTCLDVMIDDGITFSTEHLCEYECEDCPFNDWGQDYSGEYFCLGEYGHWAFSQDDIGKTIFLTQEEAEKALKELT